LKNISSEEDAKKLLVEGLSYFEQQSICKHKLSDEEIYKLKKEHNTLSVGMRALLKKSNAEEQI